MSRVNQRLNGINPLSYTGVNAYQPNDFINQSRDPLTTDRNNFYLGTWWLNNKTNSLFYLASLENDVATWVNISSMSGAVTNVTANIGGPVGPTGGNINVVGDGSTMSISGNPGASTLTISTLGSSGLATLTGNTGGAVSPTMGNINILGSSPISITGNPGTSTLTATQSNAVTTSFNTQSGTAIPAAGALTIAGSNGITTSGAGSTVTVTPGSSMSQSYITSPATGTATPASGVLTFAGSGGVTMSASGSTVTVSSTGSLPSYSTGSFTPNITYRGANSICSRQNGQYVQVGNFVYIQMDFAVTTFVTGGGPGTLTVVFTGLPFVAVNTPYFHTSYLTASQPFTGFGYSYPTQIWNWFLQFRTTDNGYGFANSGSQAPLEMWQNMQNGVEFTVSGCYLIS